VSFFLELKRDGHGSGRRDSPHALEAGPTGGKMITIQLQQIDSNRRQTAGETNYSRIFNIQFRELFNIFGDLTSNFSILY